MAVLWLLWVYGCFMVTNLLIGPGFIIEYSSLFIDFEITIFLLLHLD